MDRRSFIQAAAAVPLVPHSLRLGFGGVDPYFPNPETEASFWRLVELRTAVVNRVMPASSAIAFSSIIPGLSPADARRIFEQDERSVIAPLPPENKKVWRPVHSGKNADIPFGYLEVPDDIRGEFSVQHCTIGCSDDIPMIYLSIQRLSRSDFFKIGNTRFRNLVLTNCLAINAGEHPYEVIAKIPGFRPLPNGPEHFQHREVSS